MCDGFSLVALIPESAIGCERLNHILDRLASSRGLPSVIRTDNGKEFCGRAMLIWAHQRGVALSLIEPGKPNQHAYLNRLRGGSATNALTNFGSRASPMHVSSSKHGAANTTKNSRGRNWVGSRLLLMPDNCPMMPIK